LIPASTFSANLPFAPLIFSLEGLNQQAALVCDTYGGKGLSDPSEGINGYVWRYAWSDNAISVFRKDTPENKTELTNTGGQISRLFGTFDSNMSPLVAWSLPSGESFLRFFDFTVPGFVNLSLPAGIKEMVLVHDDIRPESVNNGTTDALCIYIDPNKNQLLYRQQRDRYQAEKLIADLNSSDARIVSVGLNQKLRLQIELLGSSDLVAGFA
jgi:hypothetical protein